MSDKKYSPKETVEVLAKHLKNLIEKYQKGELFESLEKSAPPASGQKEDKHPEESDSSKSVPPPVHKLGKDLGAESTKPVNTKASIKAYLKNKRKGAPKPPTDNGPMPPPSNEITKPTMGPPSKKMK